MGNQEKIQAAHLDQLLSEWHEWQTGYTPGRGFPRRAAGTGGFVVSGQYDDRDGTTDHSIWKGSMKSVDFQVSEMVDPYKAALYANARSLAVGRSVFSSPRLPVDRVACLEIIGRARSMLTDRLVACGVM